jgi:hypothetical protein
MIRILRIRSRSVGFAWPILVSCLDSVTVLGLVAVLVSILGCRPRETQSPAPGSDPAVATVAGRPIALSLLESEMARRSGDGGLPVDRDKILEELIDLEAVHLKARDSGFIDTPEIQMAIRRLVASRFRETWEKDHPMPPAAPDARVREIHARDAARFSRPAAVDLAIIRLDCSAKAIPEKRAEVMARAVRLRERAELEVRGMSHFGPLAAEASTDQASRYRGGELGWMSHESVRARLPVQVAAAALALSGQGAISEPVEGPDAIYLIRLMGSRPAEIRPLDEVRPQIEHQLLRESRSEVDRRWSRFGREGLSISVDRVVLEAAKSPRPREEGAPPPAPMGSR